MRTTPQSPSSRSASSSLPPPPPSSAADFPATPPPPHPCCCPIRPSAFLARTRRRRRLSPSLRLPRDDAPPPPASSSLPPPDPQRRLPPSRFLAGPAGPNQNRTDLGPPRIRLPASPPLTTPAGIPQRLPCSRCHLQQHRRRFEGKGTKVERIDFFRLEDWFVLMATGQSASICLTIRPSACVRLTAGYLLNPHLWLIEGVVRSVNNLLEKFHQSFFLYFLAAPSKFVSVGVYMIPFALLLAPLPIVAAALADSKTKGKSLDGSKTKDSADKMQTEGGSLKWLRAARVLLVIQFWAVIVSLLSYYISQIPDGTPKQSEVIWVVLSIIILIILYTMFGSPYSTGVEWKLLKA